VIHVPKAADLVVAQGHDARLRLSVDQPLEHRNGFVFEPRVQRVSVIPMIRDAEFFD
jgi:hypothetical protein